MSFPLVKEGKMTQLVDTMVQRIMQLSEMEQDQIATEVLRKIEHREQQQDLGSEQKLSDALLMPILDDEDDQLFQRNKDIGRQIDL